jgi:MoaA/NifB/PqqE/SkfB family radical SAM enzyme
MDNELLEKKTVFYVDQIRNLERGGFEFPVTCEIDPSNRCNLSCSFCMFKDRDQRPIMSWDSYCWLLDQLAEGGTKSITFTGGGEPLMNPKINSMIERADAMGFKLGLVTNGLLLDRIERPEIFMFIRVSLDAGDKPTYYKVKGRNKWNEVISNIQAATLEGAHIGLSFVVTEANKHTVKKAQKVASELKTMYIQFKQDTRVPIYPLNNVPDEDNVINMKRFSAEDTLPCKVAGLIGVVGADEKVYFCCQYRGDERACVGSLRSKPLKEMLESRMGVQPDITKCPRCRYMNYVVSYQRLIKGGLLFFDHKEFL